MSERNPDHRVTNDRVWPGPGKRQQIMEIVRGRLDATTAKIIETALDDAERIKVIRDMFLEGRDVEAVQAIRELDPVGLRKLLPFNCDQVIHLTQSAQISARPQLPFTPKHLLVSRSCAHAFVIEDIRIGQRSQTVQAGGMPADLFAVDAPVFDSYRGTDLTAPDGFQVLKSISIHRGAEDLLPVPLDLPEVQVGEHVVVVITKVHERSDDDPIMWRAAWLGTTPYH